MAPVLDPTDRDHALHVIRKKGLPGLRGRSSPMHHVFANAGLSDVDSELQKFAVNTGSAPYRVFTAHHPDQLSDLSRHPRPAWVAMPDLPGPEQYKALAMPGNHSGCFDDEDTAPPFAPDGRKPDPQNPISSGQFRPLHRALQDTKLMSQSEDLNLERRTPAE